MNSDGGEANTNAFEILGRLAHLSLGAHAEKAKEAADVGPMRPGTADETALIKLEELGANIEAEIMKSLGNTVLQS